LFLFFFGVNFAENISIFSASLKELSTAKRIVGVKRRPALRAMSFLKTFFVFVQRREDFVHIRAAERHDIGGGVLEVRAYFDFRNAQMRVDQDCFVEMTALHGFREDVAELFADPELALRGFTGFIVTH
jgi:hypothetical protein